MAHRKSKKSPNVKKSGPSGKNNSSKQPDRSRRKIFFLGLNTAIWGVIAVIILMMYYARDLPDIKKLSDKTSSHSIRLMGVDGKTQIATLGSNYGTELAYEDIPKDLINAVLATEDRRFFEHSGIDVLGLSRAMLVNVAAGRVVQGGSTLTQQLAKIVFLSPERTIKRKIQELLLAMWLEYKFSKEEIITMYLNRVYLGGGYFGIDAAAKGYFSKPAKALDIGEAAMLAGLLKAPSRYSPYSDIELTRKRTEQVFVNMVDAGYLPAMQSHIDSYIAPRTKPKGSSSYHYFADWLSTRISGYIGIIDSDLTVITTINPEFQELADKIVKFRLETEGKKRKASQAALLSMAPDGAVLAMIGGNEYQDSVFNRVTQAQRQPGSAFKYFVYMAALEQGFDASDVFEDKEVDINGWIPQNYYESYEGEMNLKKAFAESVNTIAVQLFLEVGGDKIIKLAKRLGIKSELHENPSLALGTAEVNLMEITRAFAHTANNGFGVEEYAIREIRSKDGRILYKRGKTRAEKVISDDVVNEMKKLMAAVLEEGGTGHNLKLGRTAFAKSGTSQNFRDAWFIGFTDDIVTGVWVGNDDNSTTTDVTGSSIPGRIWRSFMKRAYEILEEPEPEAEPEATPAQKPAEPALPWLVR